MRDLEHQIQRAFVQWVTLREAGEPALKLGFAVPNGGGRSIAQAGKLKAEGVRPGVPDWILAVRNSEHIGLAIEFKSPAGQVKPAQRDFINLMRAGGWLAVVCRSPESAIDVVTQYLAKLTPEQRAAIVQQVHAT